LSCTIDDATYLDKPNRGTEAYGKLSSVRGLIFNEGYWGPSVGFYGGIDYGFGYFGHGYKGGRWENGRFFYNTTLNNVNVKVTHNVYTTSVNRPGLSRISYNGGNGGINARATAQRRGGRPWQAYSGCSPADSACVGCP
jgi:hypothetical protein